MDIYKHIFVLCLTCSLGHMLTLQMCEVMLEIESEREKCMTQVENITSGCSGTWDRISCWPSARIGEVVTIPCPLVSPKAHRGNMSNTCTADGWTKINLMAALALNCGYDPNSTAPEDGAELLNPLAHSAQGNPYGAKAYGYFLWSVKIGYTVGHTVSLISLMVAIVILCIFRKLHCTRNYIHINLFMSFILKAIAVFVKDVVLFQGEEDCQPAESVGCKAAMVFFHYGAMASYFWLLVEGLYLHALLAVSFFSERKYFWWYILIGWGVPAVFITVWSIIIANFSDVGCWDMFVGGAIHLWWIIKTPILTSILINFILFIRIIRILRQKINCRDIGRHESNQYSRLAKSTLLLIPLFGINFIIFGLIPDTIHYQNTRLVFDVILGSFQGFGVAVLYCFLNGEVQSEIKRKWRRWHLQRFLGADTKYQQPSLGSNGNNFSTQITMLTKCSPTTRRASACQDDLSTI